MKAHSPLFCAVTAALFAFPLLSLAQTCPTYTHKDDVTIDTSANLPDGWFVYRIEGTRGLYKSPLRSFSQTMIPNTTNDNPYSIEISDDGQWITYVNGSSLSSPTVAIRIDGSNRTALRTDTLNYNGDANYPNIVTFIRGTTSPEICYPIMTAKMYAQRINLPATGAPTLGARRLLVNVSGSSGWTIPWYSGYSMGAYRDQVFGFFNENVGGSLNRSDYITIPNNGAGTATSADFAKYANDGPNPLDNSGYWGCGQTMSWDGQYCLANSGWVGSSCLPNKKAVIGGNEMDHKGFYVTRFLRSTATPIRIDAVIDSAQYGVSINWCPTAYRFGSYSQVDFNNWNFSNNNRYVIGSLKGTSAAVWGLWVVNWQTAKWSLVTPSRKAQTLDDPAMWINGVSGVKRDAGNITPSQKAFAATAQLLSPVSGRTLTLQEGVRTASVYSASGKLVWSYHRVQAGSSANVSIPRRLASGGSLLVRYQ